MIDLFYECEEDDIANYADDTTPYLCGTDIPTVISKLQAISTLSSTAETLLGITIDSELSFENHLLAIFNKVSRKINALGWTASYMSLEKRRIVMKTFIESQFNYCPVI